MILTNNEIYNHASALTAEFGPDCEIRFPIKVNFFLQKNIQILTALAGDIDKARISLAQQYGVLNEDGSAYTIPTEQIPTVSMELEELFAIEQDVNIRQFDINDFNNIELTYKQMNALMFMIKDE